MRLLFVFVLPLTLASVAAAPEDGRDRGPGIFGARHGDGIDYPVADFDAVAFGLPGQADIRVGPSWSVHAAGPAAAMTNVRVALNDGRLEIGPRYRDGRNDRTAERQLHFTITLPSLRAVALGGSGQVTVDRVRGNALEAAVGGSGTLTLGTLAVQRATVSIGGSGNVVAQGSTGRLSVNLGGSGSLRAPALRAGSAEISSAGSGSIRVLVDGPAQISTVGSGEVDLGPRARCTVTRLGHSTVRCG